MQDGSGAGGGAGDKTLLRLEPVRRCAGDIFGKDLLGPQLEHENDFLEVI